jgi:hypothetical protein
VCPCGAGQLAGYRAEGRGNERLICIEVWALLLIYMYIDKNKYKGRGSPTIGLDETDDHGLCQCEDTPHHDQDGSR